ncbi:hypothetical protein AB0M50_01290 [Nonomuraea fuscirosea]|jgi:hypothetical protein|uniref:hypothetical protein n=1 Tax=Nonomuraea fuscirosea TaxID=1291556 RepID=UPI002DD82C97|nr:hypothetical protein [Nonomuraea fuscirosea]WSA52045.1 hypothetical protein OIE67_49820 [Nonomuraea fuscirosea]
MMTEHGTETRPAGALARVRRPVLWLLLAVFAVCNAVSSIADVNVFIGVGFGLATLGCAAALIAQHYETRRGGRN